MRTAILTTPEIGIAMMHPTTGKTVSVEMKRPCCRMGDQDEVTDPAVGIPEANAAPSKNELICHIFGSNLSLIVDPRNFPLEMQRSLHYFRSSSLSIMQFLVEESLAIITQLTKIAFHFYMFDRLSTIWIQLKNV